MILLLDSPSSAAKVQARLAALGGWSRVYAHDSRAALWVEIHSQPIDLAALAALPGVAAVLPRPSPHPRLDTLARSPLRIAAVDLNVPRPLLIAGPCGVESPEQIDAAAAMVAAAGGQFLRGGAFKPRTSPYTFQGHGRTALPWLRRAADRHDLAVVTELTSEAEVDAVAAVADLIQIGSRNMHNFALLHAAGRAGKPVLLKRGVAARLDEWRLAAEHLLVAGATTVLFCERGVVGFDPSTRNLLDLAAVALLSNVDGHRVIVDPSHATGRRDLVLPLSRAALAAGAAGIMVECHPDAACAKSDAPQALDAAELLDLGVTLGLAPRDGPALSTTHATSEIRPAPSPPRSPHAHAL